MDYNSTIFGKWFFEQRRKARPTQENDQRHWPCDSSGRGCNLKVRDGSPWVSFTPERVPQGRHLLVIPPTERTVALRYESPKVPTGFGLPTIPNPTRITPTVSSASPNPSNSESANHLASAASLAARNSPPTTRHRKSINT